ncbi:coiled-coil domain-containing protein 102B [Suncus etruscus]|uniref:coiled-coil domain-containing protein 102B n=1 Tax=Suncus etruscus TaxID=109475 RepID=UPI00210F776D|nr:coiled-coil domain-containing protein 102B [Suncus etruscus]
MNLDSTYHTLDTCHSAPPVLQAPCALCHHPKEWDVGEELRRRELSETKARLVQMEKTMRWWSDCTANWREKWAKVRAERNSAREEAWQLRLQLEMAVVELSTLKKQQQSGAQPHVPSEAAQRFAEAQEEGSILDPLRLKEETGLNLDDLASLKHDSLKNSVMKPELGMQVTNWPLENELLDISALWVPPDKFQKILQKEQEMRSLMERKLECLESALSRWKQKYEELKESKLKNMKEFWKKKGMSSCCQVAVWIIKGSIDNKIKEILGDKKEGLKPQNSKDKMIFELRAEELFYLQHAYQKLRRQYQAKIAELMRANNLVDQSKGEVKKLRFQLEELNRGLNKKDNENYSLKIISIKASDGDFALSLPYEQKWYHLDEGH